MRSFFIGMGAAAPIFLFLGSEIMRKNIRHMTHAAIIAALYVALTLLQNFLLPGSTSMAIQFRAAEALCVLALFTPAAIDGLVIGCLLFNLTYAGALPLDPVLGTAATLGATLTMWLYRGITVKGYPLLSLMMPALWNALLVGLELTIYIGGSFWINALYVAIGEGAVLLTLGTVLFYTLKTRKLDTRLFGNG
jgi:uncharacterized membrane protein